MTQLKREQITVKHALCLLLVLAAAVFGSAPLTAQQASFRALELRLSDAGYSDLVLSGMHGSSAAFIPFQSDWSFSEPVEVQVAYVASPLLLSKRSTLTVLANDVQVTSLRPIADGAAHAFSFTVPAERLRGAGLNLRFQGYLRLTDDACEETIPASG